MDTSPALEQLGLDKREGQIYTALLANGPSSPTEIANITGIKRPNIYSYVKELEKQGLVYYQLLNKRIYIKAANPNRLTELAEEKLNLAKLVVPTLIQNNRSGFESKITFYKGRKAMQNLFNQALEMKGKELLGVWAAKDMDKILGKRTIEQFIAKRVKKGIKLKSLRPIEKESLYENETINIEGKKLTEAAYLADTYTFSLSMSIYDDKVAFFSSKEENYGFLVESKEFSQIQKMFFNIAWSSSGKLAV